MVVSGAGAIWLTWLLQDWVSLAFCRHYAHHVVLLGLADPLWVDALLLSRLPTRMLSGQVKISRDCALQMASLPSVKSTCCSASSFWLLCCSALHPPPCFPSFRPSCSGRSNSHSPFCGSVLTSCLALPYGGILCLRAALPHALGSNTSSSAMVAFSALLVTWCQQCPQPGQVWCPIPVVLPLVHVPVCQCPRVWLPLHQCLWLLLRPIEP